MRSSKAGLYPTADRQVAIKLSPPGLANCVYCSPRQNQRARAGPLQIVSWRGQKPSVIRDGTHRLQPAQGDFQKKSCGSSFHSKLGWRPIPVFFFRGTAFRAQKEKRKEASSGYGALKESGHSDSVPATFRRKAGRRNVLGELRAHSQLMNFFSALFNSGNCRGHGPASRRLRALFAGRLGGFFHAESRPLIMATRAELSRRCASVVCPRQLFSDRDG